MPLDVNNQNLFQNAQFQQFVDFAENAAAAGKQKAIARVDAGELGGIVNRTIKAGSGDWVGIGAGRLSSLKRANNTTRDAFMKAVADMFGGVDSIPDSVKDAMKLEDYGKGKPLTARRILAVKAAIDSIKTAIDSVTDTSSQAVDKTNDLIRQGKEQFKTAFLHRQGDVDRLIEVAFKGCQGNSDAQDIVKNKLESFLATGAYKIRTEAHVKERAEGLVVNLKELKALSVKNPAIYEAGKAMLKDLGKPLPPGVIEKLFVGTSNAPANDIRKLSGSSSGMAMHTAVMQTMKNVDDIISSSGAMEKLDGSEEVDQVRDFVLNVMLSRCSKAALANIRSAFSGKTAAHLDAFYMKCEMSTDEFFPNESEAVREGASHVASLGRVAFNRMGISLDNVLSRLAPDLQTPRLPDIDGDPDIGRLGGDKLLEAVVAQAKEINEQKTQEYLETMVSGSGKGADALRQVIRNKLGGPVYRPDATLGTRMGENAKSMINWTICAEMKKLSAGGEDSYFAKDINRRLNVTLTDGKNTFKLTNDFDTARDELARFVTGDDKATYQSISKPDRGKVHVLMSLLSQEFEKTGEDGVGYSLDKREGEQAFTITPDKTKPSTRTFSVEKTQSGGISIKYDMEKPITLISTDDFDEIELGAGSTYKASVTCHLSSEEFSRVADLDYSKFDDTEAYKLFNKKQDMPDGTRQFAEQKNIKIVESFSDDFKIKARCIMDFGMVLNPSDQDLIDAQR